MANKIINSRVISKHDTAANWAKATSFIPLAGEIIVYTDGSGGETTPQVKIGDGVNTVGSLPFTNVPTVVTGTLSAGDTSITLSNSAITTSSILDVYTDIYGIAPKTMVASTGSVTMTFKAQASDLAIRLEVR